jgi:5-methylcytosine-specific restriction enzyme B
MNMQQVSAVAFFQCGHGEGGSAFKAAYGRMDGGYTKDFLQASGAKAALDYALGAPPDNATGEPRSIKFTWRWPGGQLASDWQKKTGKDKRGELFIRRAQSAHPNEVLPFKLGDYTQDRVRTIPGDPSKVKAVDADAELEHLKNSNVKAWLLAIKIEGEDGILHARAVLENPPPGLEARGVDRLPSRLASAIRQCKRASGGLIVGAPAHDDMTKAIEAAFETSPNVLLVGPPGTGKTQAMERYALMYAFGELKFDPELMDGCWESDDEPECMTVQTAFHPSYQYENMVAGLVPQSAAGGGMNLVANPGPLLSLSHWIGDSNRRAMLMIDEFNRGAAASIFGDMFALLDGPKRFAPGQVGATVQRPFPLQSMKVSDQFKNEAGDREVADPVRLPLSLRILASLNSSDRSVAALDLALRRRFAIVQIAADLPALSKHLGIPHPAANTKFIKDPTQIATWELQDVSELAVRVLGGVNLRLLFLAGPNQQIGPAAYWSLSGTDAVSRLKVLARLTDHYVFATLKQTFEEQDDLLAAALALGSSDAPASTKYGHWLQPPPSMRESVQAAPRLIVSQLSALSEEDMAGALINLANP